MVDSLNFIFTAVVGSQAYGTAVEGSDIDLRGVYVQPDSHLLSFRYKEQMNADKDSTYYEIKRFLELAATGNPTMLELLFMDPALTAPSYKCDPAWQLVYDQRHKFLTKRCGKAFGGYAVAQIQKARGLNKKMNWESTKVERRDVMDFCFVHWEGKSVPVKRWLKDEEKKQKHVGLVALDRMPGAYALYYDHIQDHLDNYGPGATQRANITGRGYSGIVGEDSNDVRLSSIAKTDPLPLTVLTFNKEGYSMHCKDYREYQDWLSKRNTQRYVDNAGHGQKIDSKNLLHCRRLLDMGLEIAKTGNVTVFRSNYEYLLKIRRGEVPLQDIIYQAEKDLAQMDALFAESNLSEEVSWDFLNELILEVRQKAHTH